MLDIIETLFGRHGIRTMKYDGRMDRGSRERVLTTFKKAGGPKVMLIRCVGPVLVVYHFVC